MDKLTIIINGDNFSDLESFYHEVDQVLTKDLDWQTGHNLDAFNDLLCGGFGVYDYATSVKIFWTKFSKSRSELGDKFINNILKIIADHNHIEFETKD